MVSYYYYMGSTDKKNWHQMTPRIPSDVTFEPLNKFDFEGRFPYMKIVSQIGRIGRVLHIDNQVYWQIKNGHVCPTCGQFVYGSATKRG